MQEGLLSLLQMAKTSAALAALAAERLPFISVQTDPTTGGVSASLAMLGDVNIAEPKALIGFAGPRVIQQTVRETLPEGFQRSEFLLDHGAIDMILDRRDLRERIASHAPDPAAPAIGCRLERALPDGRGLARLAAGRAPRRDRSRASSGSARSGDRLGNAPARHRADRRRHERQGFGHRLPRCDPRGGRL